jgi:hypothetical protein
MLPRDGGQPRAPPVDGRSLGCALRLLQGREHPGGSRDQRERLGALQAEGWESYQPVPGAVVAALCKACGEKNARIMGEVAKAKRGRKRR